MSSNKFDSITVGIAVDGVGKYPGIMTHEYKDKTFEEAKELLLQDTSVKNCKLNDDVFVVRVGETIRKGVSVGLR